MRSKSENISFLSDLAKSAVSAMGALPDMKAQIRSMVQEAVDRILDRMDLVTRAEFERIEAMAAKARLKQDEMEKRLKALEGNKGAGKKPVAKTAAKKTKTRKKA